MSKIKELSENHNGKIYVYLHDEETAKRFMLDAESDGFTFGDGAKPTEREAARVMAVNRDGTINYVGAAGMIAYQAANSVGGEPLLKIDYRDILKSSK